MSISGLNWQTKNLPFGAGLQQGTDVRARPEPFLDIADDVQFDELGGVQTRHPYIGAVSPTLPDGSIFGGGLVGDVRRIVQNGDELVLMTKDALYSWNAKLSQWVFRATHLAVAVDESPQFASTGDQIDGDRAELAGTVVFAWTEGGHVFAAALDKTTGSVLVSPTAVSTAIGRPRLVALATKILLFVEASATLLTVRAIDPAAPGTGIASAGTTVLATNFNGAYDVVRAGTQDLVVGACRRQTTTSYTVFTVTLALSVTAVTKARTADGPLAVATIPDGTKTQIVRGSSTNIQGDLLTTSTLADVFTGQAIGTIVASPVSQIAVAFVSTTTAQVFWSYREDIDATIDYRVKVNTVTTANAHGFETDFVLEVGIASRAFAHDGHAYLWLVFGAESQAFTGFSDGKALGIRAQLQNTYFLYRDDGLLVSKAAFDIAGGFATSGHLPGVALTEGSTTYSWCGVGRRSIDLGGTENTTLDTRTPRDIAFTFDSNSARRCVRLGSTLYVSGALPVQYDGVMVVEWGFQVYPFLLAGSAGGGGAMAAGAYDYKATLRWTNAAGEQERSTTAIGVEIIAGASNRIDLLTQPLHVTRRIRATLAGAPAIEWWRSLVNPPDGSDFFLASGKDPTVLTGDNPYVPNDVAEFQTTLFNDNFTDAQLALKERNPENGLVLENLAPPGARVVFASDTRIFLLDVPGDLDRCWYSKLRGTGQIAAFHDTLTFDVPAPGGRITAGWMDDNGVLYVARETAIYVFTGVGKDNLGQGSNYTLARVLSQDVGVVNHESVAMTPLGTIVKSRKGWYLVTGSSLGYIGGPVADFDAEEVLAVSSMTTKHEVRILTTERMLVWGYAAATQQAPTGQWGERSIANGVDMTLWDGQHVLLVDQGTSAQGIKTEQADYTGIDYGLDVETVWVKPADVLQGASRVRKIQVLGEFRSACMVRMRVAYNYEMDGTTPRYVDDVIFDPAALSLVAGNPLQFAHGPERTSAQAIKVRLTVVQAPAFANPEATFDTLSLSTPVATAGTDWEAGWIAMGDFPGELGNALTMSIAFDQAGAGVPFSIDIRRDFRWDQVSQIWTPAVRNAGVRVVCSIASSPTVAQLEAAIQGFQAEGFIELDFNDFANTAQTINAAAMVGTTVTGPFANGAFLAPTGEGIKLTGLGLEVGVEPGLFRQLSAAQKI